MYISVIIAAAGVARRMGLPVNKPLLDLAGKPVLAHSLDLFAEEPSVQHIVVTANAADMPRIEEICAAYPQVKAVIPGGASRQESIRAALALVPPEADLVAVHDAARPLLTALDFTALVSAAYLSGAAILAGPVTDSVKTCAGSLVGKSLDRSMLVAAQTPQVFRPNLLQRAYAQAEKDEFIATDDSCLVERLGVPVAVIMAKNANLKLTYADDLAIAEMVLQKRRERTCE
ncbi:MAG: 2-C-methyl-D-erythritol 4-phosphate cytidylyltransferase [Firmicutes bacterium]|nr:2-C-methyl-D-erythritol 4-phosphate cytidylyltransferase [Bacillota bacterium]